VKKCSPDTQGSCNLNICVEVSTAANLPAQEIKTNVDFLKDFPIVNRFLRIN
jgi:hypothetical protein